MLRDRRALRQQLHRLRHILREKRPPNRLPEEIEQVIHLAQARRRERQIKRPIATFPADLPVVAMRTEIAESIARNQVTVLCGETGSGKTTQLPKICLELGRGINGMIGHTQPRRIAARSVAARIAEELKSTLGHAVGYKVRFNDRTHPETYIKLMTDGILLAETQGDRLLEAYDTLIIDEAHERSLNIDFLLGYIRQLLPKRPDLKIIITSATIDPQRFSRHFNNAPIVEVSGRTYPVETRYRPLRTDDPDEEDREQLQGILEAIDELARTGPGDVLVFLSGEREIRETAEELRKHHPPQTEILPLFARLSSDEQQRVFQPHARRRIVLATNVAETSLTVPGIRYVVDPGLARVSRYSPTRKVQRLPIEPISRASADQRKGRCGRVAEGICIRLFSEDDFNARPQFTEPEILRTNLAAVILQMMALKLGSIEKFPFVEPPDNRLIRDGYVTLHELGAVDDENQLTPLGRDLSRLPLDPKLSRMILAAEKENCLAEVMIIASALSVQDPRERPVEMQQLADEAHKQFADETGDFLSFLKIWEFFREKTKHLSRSQLRKACKQQFLSYLRLREWQEVHEQIHSIVTEMGWKPNHVPALPDNIHRALLTGLLSNIGSKSETNEYAGTRGGKFFLFPGSSLFGKKPAWVMAGELVETTRLFARTVAKISPLWVEQAAAHLVRRTYTDPQWDVTRADVIAGEKVTLRGLVVIPHRSVSYGAIDPRTAREVFITHALMEGEFRTRGEFHANNVRLIEYVRSLEARTRTRDLLLDAPHRYRFFDTRIPEDIFSGRLFEAWRKDAEKPLPKLLHMTLADVARPEVAAIKPTDFPDELMIGSLHLHLQYRHEYSHAFDGISAVIPLGLLNQVPAGPLDWLVPGLLREKIIELIRTLPKVLRTQLVPAPAVADRVLKSIGSNWSALVAQPFLDVMAHQFGNIVGQVIPKVSFDLEQLPNYLKMNYLVLDEAGKTVASGRDLVAIRSRLGIQAREVFAAMPPNEWTREKLTHWDFGDLPERVEIRRNGVTFSGFPSLVDQVKFVAMRLLDSRETSRDATRAGARRLFMLQLDKEMQYLARSVPRFDEMALFYKPLGSKQQLKDDLLSAVVDRALYPELAPGVDVRSREIFINLANDGWRRLSKAFNELTPLAGEILAEYHAIQLLLARPFVPLMLPNIGDARRQLDQLISRRFLQTTPTAWLPHVPRYLKALGIRLNRLLNAGLMRDQQKLAIIQPLHEAYETRRISHEKRAITDPQLPQFRWLLEELRVSLFAQELKTSVPVSETRLKKMLEQMTP